MTPPSTRLFLTLWPGLITRAAIGLCRDRDPWPPGAAPIATEALHLTLHFIGAVPTPRLPEIIAGLKVPLREFALHLDVAEGWREGYAVLCPGTIPDGLLRLRADLAGALRNLRLPVQSRPWRPHVTLARNAMPPRRTATITPIRWQVAEYALVQSLGRGGYEVLQRYA